MNTLYYLLYRFLAIDTGFLLILNRLGVRWTDWVRNIWDTLYMKPVRDDEVVLIVVLAKGFVERVVAVIDPIISVITTTL